MCFAQADASVDRDLVLPLRDLHYLFNVPFCGGFMALLSRLISATCYLAHESLFVSNVHGMGREVRLFVCNSCVCFWTGLGRGPSDQSALRFLTFSCPNRVIFPRKYCV